MLAAGRAGVHPRAVRALARSHSSLAESTAQTCCRTELRVQVAQDWHSQPCLSVVQLCHPRAPRVPLGVSETQSL